LVNTLKMGGKAPNFELEDQNEIKVKLSDLKGKKILLSFHPLAWTGVCSIQMKSLEKNQKKLAAINTVAFGINVDSVPSKAAWAKSLRIKKTRLLSDFWPHGAVAKSFGIFREKHGFSERANIIINESGKIIWIHIYPIGELPDMDEVLEALSHEPCECCQ
jgi:peroxiredoxin